MSNPIADQLKIGMTMLDLVNLLGFPSGTTSDLSIQGADVHSGRIERLQRRLFCVWMRPEGRYQLILLDDCLAKISFVPS